MVGENNSANWNELITFAHDAHTADFEIGGDQLEDYNEERERIFKACQFFGSVWPRYSCVTDDPGGEELSAFWRGVLRGALIESRQLLNSGAKTRYLVAPDEDDSYAWKAISEIMSQEGRSEELLELHTTAFAFAILEMEIYDLWIDEIKKRNLSLNALMPLSFVAKKIEKMMLSYGVQLVDDNTGLVLA